MGKCLPRPYDRKPRPVLFRHFSSNFRACHHLHHGVCPGIFHKIYPAALRIPVCTLHGTLDDMLLQDHSGIFHPAVLGILSGIPWSLPCTDIAFPLYTRGCRQTAPQVYQEAVPGSYGRADRLRPGNVYPARSGYHAPAGHAKVHAASDYLLPALFHHHRADEPFDGKKSWKNEPHLPCRDADHRRLRRL